MPDILPVPPGNAPNPPPLVDTTKPRPELPPSWNDFKRVFAAVISMIEGGYRKEAAEMWNEYRRLQ